MWRHGPCVCDHVESLPHLHLCSRTGGDRRRGDPSSHQRALSRGLAFAGARQVEASRGRGSRPVKACLPDEEVCLTLSRIPHVVPPPDVELPGVHAHVQAALHDVLQRTPRSSRHDVRGALPRAQPQAGAGGHVEDFGVHRHQRLGGRNRQAPGGLRMVQFRRGGEGRREGAARLRIHVRQRGRLGCDPRLPREVDARGHARGARHARGRASGTGGERGAYVGPQEESPAVEGGSRTGRAEAVCFRVGARQAGGRRADLGAPGRRTDEAVSASRGGRDQEPDSLQSILPRADAEEGACRPNRSRAPELAASGI